MDTILPATVVPGEHLHVDTLSANVSRLELRILLALYEGVHYDDESGQLLTGSLLDYAVPRADLLPAVRSHFQETPSPTNPLGVKGDR